MTKPNAINLFAGAIIVLGGMALARPAQAAGEMKACADAHAEAVEGARDYCGSLGYNYATVTTYCTDGTATGSTVTCHN